MTEVLYEIPEGLEIAPETADYLNASLTHFTHEDVSLLVPAIAHVLSLHADQDRRPSGETYGNHILRVAARPANEFGIIDKELFIAGLYHDAVEDQVEKLCAGGLVSREHAFRYLRENYSTRVANAVKGVTNPETLEDIVDREIRNNEYINHVIAACDKNIDSFIIKLSDFFDNAMRMQFNTTEAAKINGAKKYLPLFDYFYNRLDSDNFTQIDEGNRRVLTGAIKTQREYVTQLIH